MTICPHLRPVLNSFIENVMLTQNTFRFEGKSVGNQHGKKNEIISEFPIYTEFQTISFKKKKKNTLFTVFKFSHKLKHL